MYKVIFILISILGITRCAPTSSPPPSSNVPEAQGKSSDQTISEKEESEPKRTPVFSNTPPTSHTQNADLTVKLPHPQEVSAWPMAGGNPHHNVGHIAGRFHLQKDWESSTGLGDRRGAQILSAPIIGQNTIYTLDSRGLVLAQDLGTGKLKWYRDLFTPGEQLKTVGGGGLAYEGGHLFITTDFGYAIALDATTGNVVWKQKVPNAFRLAPTPYNNYLIAITTYNEIYGFALENGNIIWKQRSDESDQSLFTSNAPAVARGIVVSPLPNGTVEARRLIDGGPLWHESPQTPLRRTGVRDVAAFASPVIYENNVFLLNNQGKFRCLNLQTGEPRWEKQIGGLSTPVIGGRFIFVLSDTDTLYALEITTGDIAWQTSLPSTPLSDRKKEHLVWRGPLLFQNQLILASQTGEHLHMSPYTGEILHRQALHEGTNVPPIGAQGYVIILTHRGKLVAYR